MCVLGKRLHSMAQLCNEHTVENNLAPFGLLLDGNHNYEWINPAQIPAALIQIRKQSQEWHIYAHWSPINIRTRNTIIMLAMHTHVYPALEIRTKKLRAKGAPNSEKLGATLKSWGPS